MFISHSCHIALLLIPKLDVHSKEDTCQDDSTDSEDWNDQKESGRNSGRKNPTKGSIDGRSVSSPPINGLTNIKVESVRRWVILSNLYFMSSLKLLEKNASLSFISLKTNIACDAHERSFIESLSKELSPSRIFILEILESYLWILST